MDFYQIHVVPLNIHFGETQYLDRLTIQSARFFELIETDAHFPTTSQPNETSFINLYSHLASHYDSVISVHLSGKFSGTLRNSISAAERISREMNKPITVLDSMHVSGSLGLQVLRVAKAIEEGMTHREIVDKFHTWRLNSRIYVSVRDLKNMIRGGRVSPLKGLVARILNMKPIVSMDSEGKSSLFDKAFSQRANMKKVMKHVEKFTGEQKLWNYIILHAEAEDTAAWFTAEMKALTGKDPVSLVNISPVIGLSAGRGTAAIALMAE
jgi:DegV family protein with EDD domain